MTEFYRTEYHPLGQPSDGDREHIEQWHPLNSM